MSRTPELDAAIRDRIGSTLRDKWHLDSLVGAGGMAAVYAATHRNGSRCAIKILHAHYAHEAGPRERFLREGKIANAVSHSGRVAVLDDDVSEAGEPFLVMELLEGETLADRMKRHLEPLRAAAVLPIFDTVLDLLAACHDAGMVHRDIKPANVFITRGDGAKVIDFGVARPRLGGATRAGVALGTAAYMAPEQAMGLAVDPRSDLFSVGACLFHALGGARVHEARGPDEALVLAATRRARSLGVVAPQLPREIVAFVDKALAFDPRGRHPDARSMLLELRLLLTALDAELLIERPSRNRHVSPGMEDPTLEMAPGGYGYLEDPEAQALAPADSHTRLKRPTPAELAAATARRRTAPARR